jgi:hypothetical protein
MNLRQNKEKKRTANVDRRNFDIIYHAPALYHIYKSGCSLCKQTQSASA